MIINKLYSLIIFIYNKIFNTKHCGFQLIYLLLLSGGILVIEYESYKCYFIYFI